MRSPADSDASQSPRTPAGFVQPPEHDALRAFFSGKRRSDRRAARFPVLLHGHGRKVAGRTVDLSEGGVLVRIPDDEVQGAGPAPSMLETMKILEEHFQTGVVVGFPTLAIRIPATPIRLTQPDQADGYLLGFRFDRALEAAETAKLLPTPFVARGPLGRSSLPGARLEAVVFVESKDVMGPAIVGRVVAQGGDVLDVRAATTAAAPTASATAALLRDRAARLRVTEAGKTLWEGPVHAVSTNDAEDGHGSVDVRVEAEAPLSQELVRRFRARE